MYEPSIHEMLPRKVWASEMTVAFFIGIPTYEVFRGTCQEDAQSLTGRQLPCNELHNSGPVTELYILSGIPRVLFSIT